VSDRQPAPCGTLRGERRHRRAGERPCEPCLEARRAYNRDRYVHRRVFEPCGTDGAYQRHLRNGEDTCDACRAAHAEQGRASRERAASARSLFDQMLAEAWEETAA
jgi:hypothetical protein